MRSMKPIRMKKTVRANKSGPAKKPSAAAWWTGGPAIAGVVIGLMIVAVAGAVYESSDRPTVTRVKTDPDETVAQPAGRRVPPSSAAGGTGRVRAAAAATLPPLGDEPDMESTSADTSAVTMTGCLERADETFRLRDVDGAQVPRARSWKTGFLRKASRSVEVVPAANRLNFSNHVGERVSVTGTLVDREMRVRSLQRVAASCGHSTKIRT